jgi:hypothetical protein
MLNNTVTMESHFTNPARQKCPDTPHDDILVSHRNKNDCCCKQLYIVLRHGAPYSRAIPWHKAETVGDQYHLYFASDMLYIETIRPAG